MISENEYAPYYKNYIQPFATNGKSILENLLESQDQFDTFLRKQPKEKHNFSYAEGKWTVKEVIQHIIDTERVFTYRALTFSRGDQTQLPGFDQDVFVKNSFAKERDYYELLNEMATLRQSTAQFFLWTNEEALLQIGTASGNPMSVRAIGYLCTGHQMHHLNVLKERYFKKM